MATKEKRRGSTNESGANGDRDEGTSVQSDQDRFADNLPDDGATAPEAKYEDHVLEERDAENDEPDVLLDVPVLKVGEINLEVEDLRARVSLQAEVLDLLKLNVGADVTLGRVGLEIKGVEAQALLKVRLDNVARILDRVLTTIDRNPQILENITKAVGSAVEDVGEGAGEAVEEIGGGARQAVGELGRGAGSAVEDVGEGAGSAVEDVGEGAGSAVEDVGEGAGSAVEGVGEGAGSAVEDVGEGAGEAVEEAGESAAPVPAGPQVRPPVEQPRLPARRRARRPRLPARRRARPARLQVRRRTRRRASRARPPGTAEAGASRVSKALSAGGPPHEREAVATAPGHRAHRFGRGRWAALPRGARDRGPILRRTGNESESSSRRANLPEGAEPDVTYRDIQVDYRLATRLAEPKT